MLHLSFLILQLSTSFGVHIAVKLRGAEGDQHYLHSVCVQHLVPQTCLVPSQEPLRQVGEGAPGHLVYQLHGSVPGIPRHRLGLAPMKEIPLY